MVNILKRRYPASVLIRVILILMIGLPFIFELQDAQRNPLMPYHAHLMLGTHIALFVSVLPFVRVKADWRKVMLITGWVACSCLALLTGFWSDYPALVLQRFLMVFITSFMLFVVVFSDRDPLQSFYGVLKFVSYFGAILAVIALMIHFLGEMVWVDGHRVGILAIGPLQLEQKLYGVAPLFRVSSLTGNPNSLAAILSLSLVSTLAIFRINSLSRLFFIFIIGIQLLALILTFSRTGIGISLMTLILSYVLTAKQPLVKCVKTIHVCIIAFGIIIVLMQFTPTSISNGINNRLSVGLNARDGAWVPLIASISEKPLSGVGFGVSSEAILEPANIDIGAHNAHLAVLAEVGFVGYVILLGIWVSGIYLGVKLGLRKHLDGRARIACVTIAVLLAGLLTHQVFETSVLRFGAQHWFWLYLIATAVTLYGTYESRSRGDRRRQRNEAPN